MSTGNQPTQLTPQGTTPKSLVANSTISAANIAAMLAGTMTLPQLFAMPTGVPFSAIQSVLITMKPDGSAAMVMKYSNTPPAS